MVSWDNLCQAHTLKDLHGEILGELGLGLAGHVLHEPLLQGKKKTWFVYCLARVCILKKLFWCIISSYWYPSCPFTSVVSIWPVCTIYLVLWLFVKFLLIYWLKRAGLGLAPVQPCGPPWTMPKPGPLGRGSGQSIPDPDPRTLNWGPVQTWVRKGQDQTMASLSGNDCWTSQIWWQSKGASSTSRWAPGSLACHLSTPILSCFPSSQQFRARPSFLWSLLYASNAFT